MKQFLLVFCWAAGLLHAEEVGVEVIDLRQVQLSDAARILSEASGLNVVASVEAGKTPINLYLTNVTARGAVEALCRSHNLWSKDDLLAGIIRIHTPEEYQRDLNSFQEEVTQVFDLRFPNANDIGRAIQDLYGRRVHMNENSFMQNMQETNELQQRFQRFDIVDGRSQNLGIGQSGGGVNGGFPGTQGGFLGGQGGASGVAASGDLALTDLASAFSRVLPDLARMRSNPWSRDGSRGSVRRKFRRWRIVPRMRNVCLRSAPIFLSP
jgi:hypothetical protein